MEYLFITAFAFIMLLVIMLLAYAQSSSFSSDVAAAQIQKVGNQIVDAANEVSYAGPPSTRMLTLYFPQYINNVAVTNQTLVFSMEGQGGHYDYSLFAVTNMTGAIQSFSGLHRITVSAQGSFVNITDR